MPPSVSDRASLGIQDGSVSAESRVDKVKLRLHYGGKFEQDQETQTYKYGGGEIHNDSIPVSLTYSELCQKLNEKFGDTVSFKYQAPGEDLDPDALVAVTDNDDLQELFEEYFQALQRPGTPLKTFRIKLFVYPALQFERYEAPELQDMEASLCGQDAINFDSWCSDDISGTTAPSANPSSDTEMHWQLAHGARLAAQAHQPTEQQQLQHPLQHQVPAVFAAAFPPVPDQLVEHGLSNITKSVHRQFSSLVHASACFTAEDFCLDDPYNEQDSGDEGDGFAEVQRNQPYWGLLPEQQQQQQQQQEIKQQDDYWAGRGDSLHNKPLDRVRELALGGNLPTHISAFGDNGDDDSGGGERLHSIRLPSHISAFGEGIDMPEDPLMTQEMNGDDHKSPAWPQDDLAGQQEFRRQGSKCITQEFAQHDGSLLRNGRDEIQVSPLELNFQLAAGLDVVLATTPKLLEVVVKVAKDDVKIIKRIGEGAFGEVSQAHVFPYGSVAIKWLKKERFAKYSESFQREAEVLAKLNHPNIIRMYGLVTEADPAHEGASIIAGIMTEYVRGGSLSQQLRVLSRKLTLKERCQLAWQATLGMAYLHDQSPAVIHFDLKPDNLLVEGEGDNVLIKVADFGLSKHKFQSYVSCRDLRGTLPYMAPELVSNPNQVCEKCDVWSMGVVMWEMYTLEVPFQELSAQQILMGLMHGNLHLPVPQACEPEWRGLIEACMEPNPSTRPSMKQLATHLEAILRQLP